MAGAAAGMAAPRRRAAVAEECYRVEGTPSGGRWGDLLLPLTVTVEAGSLTGPQAASVKGAASAEPAHRAIWTRTATDSVRLTLDGSNAPPILLGAESGGRAGTIDGGARVVVRRAECEGGGSVR
jgi:hypothetical protein